MARPRSGVKRTNRPAHPEPRGADRAIVLLPLLVAIVLNLPGLGLGYFWDDFYFLNANGHGLVGGSFIPDPDAAFYRPIPLGIYFKVLRALDPRHGVLGHLLNLAALMGAVALLVRLVALFRGPRAGLYSGLIFASFAPTSSLVAWTSGSQDLFAILFVVAAFLFRHQSRWVPALLCATAGLLCKEPAIAAFPVLVLWDWIVGRKASLPWRALLAYGLIAFVWALVHPGIHLLAGRGFTSGSTGYVGLEHSERWGLYLARYLMTLFHLPPPGLTASWWAERATYGFAALAVLLGGLWFWNRGARSDDGGGQVPLGRVALIGALFALPALLMPTLLVRHWAPYFACAPALGIAILLGPALARLGRLTSTALLSIFLVLGIAYRGVSSERESVLSERAMVEASRAVRTVRENVRALFPTFPKGSQVVLSAGLTGIRGIQSALVDGQALSLWYGDPTLRTVPTRERRKGANAEYLVRVTNDLDVLAIDPDAMAVRSARQAPPDLAEIDPPLNSYARAVAADGETDRAVRIMEGLNRLETGDLIAYNRRLIASFLLAAGRRHEADSVLATAAPFPPEVARVLVLRLLVDASRSERLDSAAFEAFGLSERDPETLRWMMRGMQNDAGLAQAAWYAKKLQQVAPGDAESGELLRRATAAGIEARREPLSRVAAD